MAFVGFCRIHLSGYPSAGLNLLAKMYLPNLSSYSLTGIPMFLLMVRLLCFRNQHRLYAPVIPYSVRYRGGLAMATILVCRVCRYLRFNQRYGCGYG
jgi:TRAP-type mannitol/chloroaromatic compound transport system permease large subunit